MRYNVSDSTVFGFGLDVEKPENAFRSYISMRNGILFRSVVRSGACVCLFVFVCVFEWYGIGIQHVG